MKLLSSLAPLLAASCLTARAVTFSIDAEVLKDANGLPMQTGVVVLTAATTGAFSGPSGNEFATGGELFLYKWDISLIGEGALSDLTAPLSFTGDWDAGDPLRLYWFPGLDINASGPQEGMEFGYYSDAAGIDGSDPWITPGESDNANLKFFTADATLISAGGSNSELAGEATSTVPGGPSMTPVPEPGTFLGLTLLFSSTLGMRFRKSQKPKVC